MLKRLFFISIFSLNLASCGGGGGGGGGGGSDTTTTTGSTTKSINSGNYKGLATIIVQDQSGYATNSLSVTCTIKSPVSVNSYETESNPFNIKCGSDNQQIATAFLISSANIANVPQTGKPLVVQYWNINSTNTGFEGALLYKGNPVAINLFTGKNWLDQYTFTEKATKISMTYYSNSDTLNVKLVGSGISMFSNQAYFEADMMLSKSY